MSTEYTVTRVETTHLRVVAGKNYDGVTMRVLVSYDTPIAYHTEGHDKVFVTSVNWSRTTNGHRQDAPRILGRNYGDAQSTPQEMCDWALEFLTGDCRLVETKETTMGRKRNTRGVNYRNHEGAGDKTLFVPVERTSYRSDARYTCTGRSTCDCIGCTKDRW